MKRYFLTSKLLVIVTMMTLTWLVFILCWIYTSHTCNLKCRIDGELETVNLPSFEFDNFGPLVNVDKALGMDNSTPVLLAIIVSIFFNFQRHL